MRPGDCVGDAFDARSLAGINREANASIMHSAEAECIMRSRGISGLSTPGARVRERERERERERGREGERERMLHR